MIQCKSIVESVAKHLRLRGALPKPCQRHCHRHSLQPLHSLMNQKQRSPHRHLLPSHNPASSEHIFGTLVGEGLGEKDPQNLLVEIVFDEMRTSVVAAAVHFGFASQGNVNGGVFHLFRLPSAPRLALQSVPIGSSDGLRRRNTAEHLVNVLAAVSDGAGASRVQNGPPIGTERHLDIIMSLTSGRCRNACHYFGRVALVSDMDVRNVPAWIIGSAAHVVADRGHCQWDAGHDASLLF